MAKAKWKFRLTYSNDVTGDVTQALRSSGFGVLEAEALAQSLAQATELGVTIDKDSSIDPRTLFENLSRVGLAVKWVNEPAA